MDALRLLSRSTGLKTSNSKPLPQRLPSASGHGPGEDISDSVSSRKRKRDSASTGEVSRDEKGVQPLSEAEVRQVQKKYRIKIVDLNSFRKSSELSESRKVQKEQSRLYPQPLTSFDQIRHRSVNKSLLRNVSTQAYFEPTEVQMATIPLFLPENEASNEPNLLTIAPTGSGKTLAFLIPLIEKISRSHRQGDDRSERHVSAIILAPTRELMSQIVNEGRKLCLSTGVNITAMRKGMRLYEGHSPMDKDDSDNDDDAEEDEGLETLPKDSTVVKSDILVSTPMSLVHALNPSWKEDESSLVHPLPNIETLIFDEADVLLDPLFRAQTLAVWSACTSPLLRISMWSATIGSNIEELAVQTISERQKVLKIRRSQRPPLLRTIIGLKDTSLPTISHKLTYVATESGKLLGMRQLLHPSRPTPAGEKKEAATAPLRPPFLVFTQTIDRAQSLYDELRYDIPAAAGGLSRIAVLHSSLPDKTRSKIMQDFRLGKIWILITTDLLSRGVDFRGVNVVVNYDIPNTVASYVHRAGRTGRAGREGGVCVSFYTKEDIQYVKGIANIIAASEKVQVHSDSPTGVPNGNSSTVSNTPKAQGIQPWLLHALPSVSKSTRKDLKQHGVESRRAIHGDDDEKTKRMKRKAKIGTQSGYEKREVNRKRGAIEHSQRAKEEPHAQNKSDEWEGFG
ncbi:RNA-dependent ATPase rok1 [Elasticomyces elasticus]|uniref:ATP-dependent RNA helicase ROK1 n=1 Tax=Exophiala sideris TaxID=1016849 RepID=A0ABR0IXX6_9EURO|nr:RNA-dependent ATPase rok1 [Elasticomyces elasticus]KAK5022297.1 RNA-dependent ATPase rok1 [Exophiala sideris]KAK5027109.1 RNA-dependent ATPase rok1 [Exophiala sideris]KAK5051684.1 RNA-dependent ATPase rok1 [Exophiala sideris]KAK5177649.1 RNA-dependent ATPase rok1 [Eurotiomycetes sp. CCFEE 6388]